VQPINFFNGRHLCDVGDSENEATNSAKVLLADEDCDCPEEARMHMMDYEDDECTICGKKF
jgi:hypothetical protein